MLKHIIYLLLAAMLALLACREAGIGFDGNLVVTDGVNAIASLIDGKSGGNALALDMEETKTSGQMIQDRLESRGVRRRLIEIPRIFDEALPTEGLCLRADYSYDMISSSSKKPTVEDCRSSCRSYDKCLAFSYVAASTYCYLYGDGEDGSGAYTQTSMSYPYDQCYPLFSPPCSSLVVSSLQATIDGVYSLDGPYAGKGRYHRRGVDNARDLFWLASESRWIMGDIEDPNVVQAYSEEDVPTPLDVKTWNVFANGAYQPVDGGALISDVGCPTNSPTTGPPSTLSPSSSPSWAPSSSPSRSPPSGSQSTSPSRAPSRDPSVSTSSSHSMSPTRSTSSSPSISPTSAAVLLSAPVTGQGESSSSGAEAGVAVGTLAAVGAMVGGGAYEYRAGKCIRKKCEVCEVKKPCGDFPVEFDKCPSVSKVCFDCIKKRLAKESNSSDEIEMGNPSAATDSSQPLGPIDKALFEGYTLRDRLATMHSETVAEHKARERAVTECIDDLKIMKHSGSSSTAMFNLLLRKMDSVRHAVFRVESKQDQNFEIISKMILDTHEQPDGPDLFVVLPDIDEKEGFKGFLQKLKSTVKNDWIVYLPCQYASENAHCHLTDHKGYKISITKDSVRQLSKVISVGLKVAAVAVAVGTAGAAGPLAGLIPEGISDNEGLSRSLGELSKVFNNEFGLKDNAWDQVEIKKGLQTVRDIIKEAKVDGEHVDENNKTGGLQRIFNGEKYRWICKEHAESEKAKIISTKRDPSGLKLAPRKVEGINEEVSSLPSVGESGQSVVPLPESAQSVEIEDPEGPLPPAPLPPQRPQRTSKSQENAQEES